MKAKVNYTQDWTSENGDDQIGRIIIDPESGGRVSASWECRGGKGRGARLLENTSQWTDEFCEKVLDTADLCQGIGEYIVEITEEEYEWSGINGQYTESLIDIELITNIID